MSKLALNLDPEVEDDAEENGPLIMTSLGDPKETLDAAEGLAIHFANLLDHLVKTKDVPSFRKADGDNERLIWNLVFKAYDQIIGVDLDIVAEERLAQIQAEEEAKEAKRQNVISDIITKLGALSEERLMCLAKQLDA